MLPPRSNTRNEPPAPSIKNWAKEYARHLSVMATPSKGRTRQFNDDDIRVFALVAEMKSSRLSPEEIHAALDTGQRSEPPNPVQDIVSTEDRKKISLLQAAYETVAIERDELAGKFQQSQLQVAEITGTKNLLEKQLEDAQSKLDKLNQEIGMLKAQLKTKTD